MTAQDILPARNTAPSNQPRGQQVSGDVWKSAFAKTPADRLATFLGWFSIGLGAAEVLTPRGLGRMIGVRARPGLTRFMGLREIGAGIGILTSRNPAGWVKARVAGDALDLATLAAAFGSPSANPAKLAGATAAVAGVTALDIICAINLSSGPAATMNKATASEPSLIEKTIAINRSPQECYTFWHNFANLPRFMEYLDSVQVLDGKRSHWKAKAVGGKSIEWDAEVTQDEADRVIEWRSVGSADVQNSGTVTFEPRPSGPGTMVRVQIQYTAPGGSLGSAASKLFGAVPEHMVREDLRRFKRVIETGEVPTISGQPTGRKGGRD